MDIEFETSLWTRISSLLEKNNTKNTVSRNEPFSEHSFLFSRHSQNLHYNTYEYLYCIHNRHMSIIDKSIFFKDPLLFLFIFTLHFKKVK